MWQWRIMKATTTSNVWNFFFHHLSPRSLRHSFVRAFRFVFFFSLFLFRKSILVFFASSRATNDAIDKSIFSWDVCVRRFGDGITIRCRSKACSFVRHPGKTLMPPTVMVIEFVDVLNLRWMRWDFWSFMIDASEVMSIEMYYALFWFWFGFYAKPSSALHFVASYLMRHLMISIHLCATATASGLLCVSVCEVILAFVNVNRTFPE